MNSTWKSLFTICISIAIAVSTLLPLGCDVFEQDGTKDDGVITGGYFYLLERSSASLIMLDHQMRELKRWQVDSMTHDLSVQGLTFDGSYLWIAAAGGVDQIFRVDASGDTLTSIKSFSAPPSKKGTIRGLAWDGSSLWALNSGSTTSSVPATVYKLNPTDGTILAQYQLPSHDPRALTYVPAYMDVYHRSSVAGIVYTDVTTNKVYKLLPELSAFDTLFTSPTPPRGTSYVSPYGITTDGEFYWIINSSGIADHLYKLSYTGHPEERFDLPYPEPGAIVYTTVDVRIPPTPGLIAVTPNQGVQGRTLSVDVYGSEFVNRAGLTVSFGSGVTVDSIQFVSTTQLHVTITIDSTASAGNRNVTVTNPGGHSVTMSGLFQVTLTPPVTHLWLIESDLDSLYNIRFSDSAFVMKKWDTHGIAAGGSPQGLAYDGSNIWLCAAGTDKKLYKLKTTDSVLSALKTIPAPTQSGTLRGITFEAGSMWVVVSTVGKIYRVDTTNGVIQDSVLTPGTEPRAVVFANGRMYTNDTSLDSVYVYNGSTQSWSGVFATPTPTGGTTANRFATGMAWDGNYFWISNSTNNFDNVYQVTSSGIVLQSFVAPRVGPALLSGLVITPN